MKWTVLMATLLIGFDAAAATAEYPPAQAPAIPDGMGYVAVPGAAVPIDAQRSYKAIVNAVHAAAKPKAVLPSLLRASLMVNALTVGNVPPANIKVVVVFHGPSVDGLLRNEGYRKRFGIDNPNLKVIQELTAAGVPLFVCAQHMAGHKQSMDTLVPEAKLATAASLVLVSYENDGYALLSDD